MTEVYLALGSNLGDRKANLIKAIDQLKIHGEISSIAGLYQTSPYGYTQQPYFYNSAVSITTAIKPTKLLTICQEIEKKIGRKRRVHWRAREIDLDIIFYGNQIIHTKKLIVPHPDFFNRRFVLQPLADISGSFISPTNLISIVDLLKISRDKTEIKIIARNWYLNGIKI